MDYTALVFVYRTDANPLSLGAELVRELRGDDRYECSLCHLTYGTVLKRPEWVRFTDRLPIPTRFHLRSRFTRAHPELAEREYPMVFVEDSAGSLHDFLDAADLRACDTVDDLMVMVRDRLDALLRQRSR